MKWLLGFLGSRAGGGNPVRESTEAFKMYAAYLEVTSPEYYKSQERRNLKWLVYGPSEFASLLMISVG